MSDAARLRLLNITVVYLWRSHLGRHEPVGVCRCCAGPMPLGQQLCEVCAEGSGVSLQLIRHGESVHMGFGVTETSEAAEARRLALHQAREKVLE